jgi:hypothetical protein
MPQFHVEILWRKRSPYTAETGGRIQKEGYSVWMSRSGWNVQQKECTILSLNMTTAGSGLWSISKV